MIPSNSGPEPQTPLGSTVDATPQWIGRYRILGRLGAGGMGVVFLAEDTELQRRVALKVPHLHTHKSDPAKAVQRFMREARAAAAIRHPHVCPLHDIGQQDGCPYVVMPFIEGASLAEKLQGGQRIDDPREAARVGAEIAEALAAVHAHGIIHRDLKPGNILLDRQGNALLTDFGLARPTEDQEHITAEGGWVGTPAYMAPEQVSGAAARVGPRTDIFGLGMVLYHMVTGRLPFDGPALAILTRLATEPMPPPSRFRPELDPRLEGIILRAIARDPDQRFGSAEEMAQALREWLISAPSLSALPSTVTYAPPPTGTPPPPRRTRLIAAVVGLSLLAILTFFLWFAGYWPGQVASTPTSPTAKENVEDAAEQRLKYLLQRVAAVNAAEAAQPSPRVSVGWDVEREGVMQKNELPFVIGVLADLQGNQRDARPLDLRKFIPLDRDNFSQVLSKSEPVLKFTVPNRLTSSGPLQVDLKFGSISDFEPMGIVRQVPALASLLEERRNSEEAGDRVTQLDRQLSAQVVEILHHADFRRLEATWRGLHYLVHRAATGTQLKIRVFHAPRTELLADVKESPDFKNSVRYRKIFEEEFGQLGGEPYGLLIGDYEFGPEDEDLLLLTRLAQLAEYGQVPFIAAASPRLLGEARFVDVAGRLDRAGPANGVPREKWRQFRAQGYAAYVGLTAPRVLARLPYGDWGRHLPEFVCEEFPEGLRAEVLPWMSAAWPFAAVVADNFAQYGWFARVCAEEGGGRVVGLPRLRAPAAGQATAIGTTVEVAWSAGAEAELARRGILALWEGQGQQTPLFLSATSCFQPDQGSSPDLQARAATLVRLNVLLCATHFARTMMVMSRDKIGSIMEVSDCERWLRNWLHQYTLGNEKARAPEEQAQYPVTLGKIDVREAVGQKDGYQLLLRVRPIYQFDPPLKHAVELRGVIPRKS